MVGKQLRFNQKGFNNDKLQQCDFDGQCYYLDFLIRNYKWEIKGNSIIFSTIISQEHVDAIIKNVEMSSRVSNMSACQYEAGQCVYYGAIKRYENLSRELNEIIAERNKTYEELKLLEWKDIEHIRNQEEMEM